MVAGMGWTKCKFSDVLEGDQFRLFEATGEPVVHPDGESEFTAVKDAYQAHGGWCLETKDEE